VRNRFHAAANQVKVSNRFGIQNAKCVEALWRKIKVPFRIVRRGSHKKHRLPPDELGESFIDFRIAFAQFSSLSSRPERCRSEAKGNAERRDLMFRLCVAKPL